MNQAYSNIILCFIEIENLGSARSFKDNNYDQMQIGQTREFEIDKDRKKNCRLPMVDNKIKIKIKKLQEPDSQYMFITIDAEAYVVCEAGYVSMLNVEGNAKECGIGKMLMMLCLNEEEIHNVVNDGEIHNDKNKAVSRMESYSRINLPKAKELEKWIKSKCIKMIYLTMTALPKNKAHVYFNSALDSGFTQMFIAFNFCKGFYPTEGPCTVKSLKERYTDEGFMTDDGDENEVRMVRGDPVKVWGNAWFFCKPKIPLPMNKCTDL